MLTQKLAYRVEETQECLGDLMSVLDTTLQPVASMLLSCWAAGGKVLVCGNGGSAAQAQHFVAELVVRYETERRALGAVALTADTSVLTATANDYDYRRVFSRQVDALGRPGDILVAFSTSGKSPNCLEAIHSARRLGMGVVGISGRKGMDAHCDIDVICPGGSTAIIQVCHLMVVHLLCEIIDSGVPK